MIRNLRSGWTVKRRVVAVTRTRKRARKTVQYIAQRPGVHPGSVKGMVHRQVESIDEVEIPLDFPPVHDALRINQTRGVSHVGAERVARKKMAKRIQPG